jgi:integrase
MMLGTALGLRACDIINLRIGDIDWVNGEIKFIQAKTTETAVLPLTKSVGEALQDYILNARPDVASNHVFIRINAPLEPIKAAVTIGEIYSNCRKAAGLPINKRFHTLRRTLGTSMVTSGVPVTTVAQVLGHTDIDSTKKYIALDSAQLKLCALSFDGIASTIMTNADNTVVSKDGGAEYE